MKRGFIFICVLQMLVVLAACKGGNTKAEVKLADSISVPSFCEDSAMASIIEQCAYGPRLLGTKAHDECGRDIADAFRRYGCEVNLQETDFRLYNGKSYKGFNIIASVNPEAKVRVMICAHWDSRPWADADADPANHKKPVLAANDGASGVAVMLEMARLLNSRKPDVGVDFVCFDAEDAGVADWDTDFSGTEEEEEASWCLGSQYWAKNPHRVDFEFAVLLDMVGGKNATFYKEQFSQYYAPGVVERVWETARRVGFASYFPDSDGGAITDDHLSLNRLALIPAIDIIDHRPNRRPGFCPTWHTVQDTPENIDPRSLKAVGQTLLQLMYEM